MGLGSVFGKWYWEVGSVSEFRISLDNFFEQFEIDFGSIWRFLFVHFLSKIDPRWPELGPWRGEGGRFHRFRGRPEGQAGVQHRPKTFRKSISNVSFFVYRFLTESWTDFGIQNPSKYLG